MVPGGGETSGKGKKGKKSAPVKCEGVKAESTEGGEVCGRFKKKKKTYLKQTIYRINILSIFTFRCKKGRADLSPA